MTAHHPKASMIYATTVATPTVMPPKPERNLIAPTMSWAQMAAKEGHRKGFPPTPKFGELQRQAAISDLEIQAADLLKSGPMAFKAIKAGCGTSTEYLERALTNLTATGQVKRVALPSRVLGSSARPHAYSLAGVAAE